MTDFAHAFSSGVLQPDEVKNLHDICDRISAEPWFSKRKDRREALALYVLQMYRRGMVIPEKLEAICRAAARAHFADDEGLAPPRLGLDGHRLLVVEDEPLLAGDVIRRITALGAIVVGPAATVKDALCLVEDADLDAALLDIALEGEMVFPVAAMLRLKKVPFAFVSGYDKPEVPVAFRNVPIFSKPADWSEVASYLVAAQNC